MGNLFGRHKKAVSRITEQDKAILQLKQQRDKLKQYQKKIERNLERDRQLAKKLLAEDKRDRAKLLLRKKKYQENLLQSTDVQLEKLEQLTHDLEFTQIEVQVNTLQLIHLTYLHLIVKVALKIRNLYCCCIGNGSFESCICYYLY